jgi:flagellar biosynthesis protein FliR
MFDSLIITIIGGSLVFARASGVLWTAPGLAHAGLSARTRLIASLLLTLLALPFAGGPSETVTSDLAGWSAAASKELMVGLFLGLSAGLIIAAARQAGELAATVAGLAPASLFDPELDSELTPLGHVFGWLAMGAFLALGGPILVFKALVESYQAIPLGSLELSRAGAIAIFNRATDALEIALSAAAPIACALVFASIVLAIIIRSAPTPAIWSMSLPIRICLGLVLALAGLAGAYATFVRGWSAWPSLVGLSGG